MRQPGTSSPRTISGWAAMLFFSKTRMIATLAMVALSFYLALPNVLPANVRAMLPLFNGPVVLGLDLQGGSHVLL